MVREDLLQPFTEGFTHAKLPQALLKSDSVGTEQRHGCGIIPEII